MLSRFAPCLYDLMLRLSQVDDISLWKILLVEGELAIGLVLGLEIGYRDGCPIVALPHFHGSRLVRAFIYRDVSLLHASVLVLGCHVHHVVASRSGHRQVVAILVH